MPRSLEKSIATFAAHFNSLINRIEDYNLDSRDTALKKVILVSIIDALSVAVSKPQDRNQTRFTELVSEFGGWPEHTRVSATHLDFLLPNVRDEGFDDARAMVRGYIDRHSDGRLVPVSEDPELKEILTVWPESENEKVWENVTLASLTHLRLFYAYRNSLVHELREPGYGMEFGSDDANPYYHGMTTVNDNDETDKTLELVYPLGFFLRISRTAVSNLEKFFCRNRIDPYAQYRFGSAWLKALNG